MKERLTKLGRALLYPPVAVIIILVAVSTVLLTLALSRLSPENPIAILCYLVAAYTLTAVSMRVPGMIGFFKRIKNDNRFIQAYLASPRMQVRISLHTSLIINGAYALFQFFLGLRHASVWYYSLAGYYLMLSVMRFLLLGHTRSYAPGERPMAELRKYGMTGWLLLVLNLALTGVITLTVIQDREIIHHEITVISMAAYTFTAFTLAILNIVKFKKYRSPVFSAAKLLSLVAAAVSMLSLESSMLVTFGGTDGNFDRIMLALTGGAVSLTVLVLSVLMIVSAARGLKKIRENNS